MKRRRYGWGVVLVLTLLIAATGCSPAPEEEAAAPVAEPALGMCPVMPDHAAQEALSVVYQGETVYLCCNWCVEAFEANPEQYLEGKASPEEPHHHH